MDLELAIFSPILPVLVFQGSGVAEVSGGTGAGPVTQVALAGGSLATAGLGFPATPPFSGLVVTASNGAASFASGAGPAGAFGGPMAILGTLRLCLIATCAAPGVVTLPLPLDVVGVGGSTMVGSVSGITLIGAPWTTGPVTLSTTFGVSFFEGFRVGPAGLASSTALPSGRIQLLSPVSVRTTLQGLEEIPFVAVLDVHFVPEPRGLLLGVSALALLGLGYRSRPTQATSGTPARWFSRRASTNNRSDNRFR